MAYDTEDTYAILARMREENKEKKDSLDYSLSHVSFSPQRSFREA